MLEKFDLKNLKPALLFTLLLFLMCLEDLTDIAAVQAIFKHIDEVLVILCIAYLVLHIHYVFQKKSFFLYLWIAFMAIGTVSSLLFRYQALIPSVVDALVVVNKFVVGYLSAYVYASLHPGDLARRVEGTARIITVVLFLIGVHDLVMTPFFPLGEFRYFSESLVLMFPHQTYLAAAMVTLLILLGYTNRGTQNIPYMLMASFVGFMTLRGKAIAFFAVYWVLFICTAVFKKRNYAGMIVGGGIASVFIASEQIVDYFLDSSRYSPRSILMSDGISLALSHFPFGTGFGSFGSTLAAQYYSPLYTQFGYMDNYGMGPQNPMFLSDSFWPEIFAQFGVFGTILFLVIICYLIARCIQTAKRDSQAGFGMLMIMINMLINSLAETSFFNPASFLLFILFGLFEVAGSRHPKRLV